MTFPQESIPGFFVTPEEIDANLHTQTGQTSSTSANGLQHIAELLSFGVAEEDYGIDIVEIQEIIKVPPVTEVPRANACMMGIISLRGTIVPLLDLRALLKLTGEPISRASRILVLRGDGEPLGLLVDRVSSVVRFNRENIQPVPRTMQKEASHLLEGVGRDGERMLIILNLKAVFSILEGQS